MSQGKKDKFLPVYFSVLGAGVLGLGYMAWSASSASDEAEAKYQSAVTQLKDLESEPIARNAENADKKKADVEAYVKQVQELSTTMLARQAPVPAIGNEIFQRELSQARDAILAAAKDKNVKIDPEFSFGMDRYLAAFPESGAAPKLKAQLDALVFLTTAAMDAGLTEINSIVRTELDFEKEKKELTPEEKKKADEEKKRAEAAAKKTAVQKGKDKNAPKETPATTLDDKEVVERQPVMFTVTGKNDSVLRFLETLANASPENNAPHFIVIRTLRVENEMKDGPAKGLQVEDKEEEDPVTKVKIRRNAKFVLGGEKVQLQLDLDIVRFLEEPSEETKGKSSKPAKPAATAANP